MRVSGGSRKLHTCSFFEASSVKVRAARMGERNGCNILVENVKGRNQLGALG
jgi:hypothetical protein